MHVCLLYANTSALQSEAITKLVCYVIDTHGVKGEGFKELVWYLAPKYVMPSKATVAY